MRLRIELHTYWLCGTGRGEGPGADELCAKSREHLPVIPGRTLKGLLREAAGFVAEPTEVVALFGSAVVESNDPDYRLLSLEAARFRTQPGVLRIDSATLGASRADSERWRLWATSDEGRREVPRLFTGLASTRVDHQSGTAKDQSLRTIEVAVPMTLHAQLALDRGQPERIDASRARAILSEAASLVRAIGSHRHRGLGRATMTLEADHA